MNGIHVCGQTIVETSMYTMVRRLLPVQQEYYGTVRGVKYSKKSKVCTLRSKYSKICEE